MLLELREATPETSGDRTRTGRDQGGGLHRPKFGGFLSRKMVVFHEKNWKKCWKHGKNDGFFHEKMVLQIGKILV
jgi:hypothetical protein